MTLIQKVNSILLILAFLGGASLLLISSEKRTQALMAIGECVEQKADADNNASTAPEQWQAYADVCANEYEQ